ncbi:MAG: metal ABC transporter substrate-binding protein [Rhodothermia bacterium]|nr:metal ABC transporter substrate-binding protein [Rhodothermia bacterium]
MHRAPITLLPLIGALVMLAGCQKPDPRAAGAPIIYTTLPVVQYVVEDIVSPHVEVRRLLDPGSSPHSYEPVPSDARSALDAVLIVYASRNLDRWAARLAIVESLELLSLVPDSLRYYTDSAAEDVDPHFWLDPLALRAAVERLPSAICPILPEQCSRFTAAADSLAEELIHLDSTISDRLKQTPPSALVLATPFFGYFARRYDLEIAASLGRGGAVDSSPRQIANVVQRLEASRQPIAGVVTEANESQAASQMVADMLKTRVILIDPVGGSAGRQSYNDLMHYNLQQLLEDS